MLTRILDLLVLLDSDVCFSTIAVNTSNQRGGGNLELENLEEQQEKRQQIEMTAAAENSVVLDADIQDMGDGFYDGYEHANTNQVEQEEMKQIDSPQLGDTNINTNFGGKTTSFAELGLTPQDKQVISIAKRYEIMLNGAFWREVCDALISEGITPIDSDNAKIQYFLKESFNAASMVLLEHFELNEVEKGVKREESQAFINKILDQKTQQIKAEWIKKNSRKKSGKGQ